MPVRATVIGTGRLGTTHAACLAESGHQVLGIDTDPATVATLAAGDVPFHEPGLGELVRRHVASGRLRFSSSYAAAGDHGDVHFVCVGTPQRPDGLGADLDHLERAIDALAPHLRRQCLVVGKSTVPVGTAERLAVRLTESAPAGGDVGLAWNPEFLREGRAVADSMRPDRIVVGIGSEIAEKLLREVYAPQLDCGVPLVVTDIATAELVKVAANAFLATKVSFMNAMAELCEATGADVVALGDAMGRDERIGRHHLAAGLGFGGGCLPKDVRALIARAGELGATEAVTLLQEVDAINTRRPARLVGLARVACGGSVLGKRIGVLGAAFKPGSDDVRDSPALTVAAQLHLQGASVCVYDPVAGAKARELFPALGYASSVTGAARSANLLLHLTDWDEFRDVDPRPLGDVVADRSVIDGRNSLDAERWRQAGWTYRALGRP